MGKSLVSCFFDSQCIAALPCNLSLLACFADINVSLGSVATYARSCGIFDKPLYCKFTKETLVKKMWKSVKIWQNYGRLFVASLFSGTPRMLTIANPTLPIISHPWKWVVCVMWLISKLLRPGHNFGVVEVWFFRFGMPIDCKISGVLGLSCSIVCMIRISHFSKTPTCESGNPLHGTGL